MKLTLKYLTLFVVLVLLLVPTSSARAQGVDTEDGRVIFGSNYTLESGEEFKGDLVVFGGNVTIEEDALLEGNVVVFGGTVSSNGNVDGDIVTIGGQVKLDEQAEVTGDVVTIGGQIQRAEGAVVLGDVVNNVAPKIDLQDGVVPPAVVVPDVPGPRIDFNFNPFVQFFQIIFWAVIIAAFAMMIMLFLQTPIERAGRTIVTQPLMSGAIGLLAVMVALIFALTIVPPLVVAFAWLFGIVAIGREVGERFATAINQRWTPVITAGTGTFLLMLVGGAIGTIPCLGGILLFLVGLLGVGGSISTWFNLQPSLKPGVTAYTPPTDPGQVPPAS